MIIEKAIITNQNSYLFLASESDTLLPFLFMNLSVSLGLPIVLCYCPGFKNDIEMNGNKILMPRTMISNLEPKPVLIMNVTDKRNTIAKYPA